MVLETTGGKDIGGKNKPLPSIGRNGAPESSTCSEDSSVLATKNQKDRRTQLDVPVVLIMGKARQRLIT